jgi:2-haloacid dehalogenase
MQRRNFLGLMSAGLGGGCAPAVVARAPVAPRARIRAICFDLFTIFDPRPVVAAARAVIGDEADGLCEAWRTKQFGYSWLRGSAEQYVDFRAVTYEALLAAERARKLVLTDAQRNHLVDQYSALPPWPDTRDALAGFRKSGLRLATLANYSPAMQQRLIGGAGLLDAFDALISTDAARTFKPNPRAYGLGPQKLGLKREEIAFSAFGGWDAAGAKWFGFPTFWVNRLGVASEELPPGPDATGPTLTELGAFVERWPG